MRGLRAYSLLSLAIILALLATVILAVPALGLVGAITVSPASGPVGTIVGVTGTGFTPSSTYTVTFAGTAITTGTVSATGTLSAAFVVPSYPAGAQTVAVTTTGADTSNAATFTITPQITLSSTSVQVGSSITVNGSGFGVSSTVTIYVDGSALTSTTTNTGGSFAVSFAVPQGAGGSHTVTATDSLGNTASSTYSVALLLTINQSSLTVGAQLTINGASFAASSTVTIYIDGIVITSTTTSTVGSFTVSLAVPQLAGGTHTLTAADYTNSTSASFTVQTAMSITPTSAPAGATVTASGTGFRANQTISLTYDAVALTTIPTPVVTNANGGFSATFAIPVSSGRSHQIVVSDGMYTANALMTVLASMKVTPVTGNVGTQVTVSGTSFDASKAVIIKFDTFQIGNASTDANGGFSVTINVPPSINGAHAITASDGTQSSSASFTTTSSMSLDPTKGQIGAEIAVSGTGFAPSKAVAINFAATQLKTTTTDTNGSFSDKFVVPQYASGDYTVTASDGVNSVSATFTLTVSAKLSQTTGNVGSNLTATGTGFVGSISVRYDATVVATVTPDASGAFSATFKVPASVHGDHTVAISDALNTLKTTFTMESVPPPVPALLLPMTSAKGESQTLFTWQPVTDPSGVTYTFQLAAKADFSTLILQKQGLTVTKYELTKEERLSPTKKDTWYYWRVKAIDGAANESAWPEANQFYVSWFPDWTKTALLVVGSLIAALFFFWLGRITARV